VREVGDETSIVRRLPGEVGLPLPAGSSEDEDELQGPSGTMLHTFLSAKQSSPVHQHKKALVNRRDPERTLLSHKDER
jgi:hypothetical protein